MGRGKMSMGYVEVATTAACPLFPAGATARGQVFHFSEIVQARRAGGVLRGLELGGLAGLCK